MTIHRSQQMMGSYPAPGAEPTKYTPAAALEELEAQHDQLRGMMDSCEALADALDAGRMSPLELTRQVARLREAFAAHNKFEEQLLRPVLLDIDTHASVRLGRMIEDHEGEHRAMRARLDASQTDQLRDAIELLRAHLDAEERYLLAARVFRDAVDVESEVSKPR